MHALVRLQSSWCNLHSSHYFMFLVLFHGSNIALFQQVIQLMWSYKRKGTQIPGLFFFFKILFYFLKFLQRGEGRERERNINVREKHKSIAFPTRPNQGPGLEPRHVPWLGSKQATFHFADSAQPSCTSQGYSFFKSKVGFLKFFYSRESKRKRGG